MLVPADLIGPDTKTDGDKTARTGPASTEGSGTTASLPGIACSRRLHPIGTNVSIACEKISGSRAIPGLASLPGSTRPLDLPRRTDGREPSSASTSGSSALVCVEPALTRTLRVIRLGDDVLPLVNRHTHVQAHRLVDSIAGLDLKVLRSRTSSSHDDTSLSGLTSLTSSQTIGVGEVAVLSRSATKTCSLSGLGVGPTSEDALLVPHDVPVVPMRTHIRDATEHRRGLRDLDLGVAQLTHPQRLRTVDDVVATQLGVQLLRSSQGGRGLASPTSSLGVQEHRSATAKSSGSSTASEQSICTTVLISSLRDLVVLATLVHPGSDKCRTTTKGDVRSDTTPAHVTDDLPLRAELSFSDSALEVVETLSLIHI